MTFSHSLSKNREYKIAFMPIKPVYAERLINGKKHFEFRRRPISFDLTHIVIYASSPVKRILGVAKVNRVRIGNPDETWAWAVTENFAGIDKKDFKIYFYNSNIAYSIEIDPSSIVKLDTQINPKEIEPDFQVPQSFKYVSQDFLGAVLNFCNHSSLILQH